MAVIRASRDERLLAAIDDLKELGRTSAAVTVVTAGVNRVDVRPAGSAAWIAEVVARESVGVAEVGGLGDPLDGGRGLLVSDRISVDARSLLIERGWSWFDRRFGACFVGPDRTIEVHTVPPGRKASPSRSAGVVRFSGDGPIRGRGALAYAVALLADPDDPPTMRSVGRSVGMSPTSISNAARDLSDAGLALPEGLPALPDLFDAVAACWGWLQCAPVAVAPRSDDSRLDTSGWALGGDTAAAELGAPIVSIDERPLFWLPDQTAMRQAERYLGPASWDDRGAALAVAPTPLVTERRRPAGPSGWPLIDPLFVALDLAQDKGRGREILARWKPKGTPVVWR